MDPYIEKEEKMFILNLNNNEYQELKPGLKVVDIEDLVDPISGEFKFGTVRECHDIHNVIVDYDDDQWNLYCLVKGCKEEVEHKDSVSIIGSVDMYDPTLRSI